MKLELPVRGMLCRSCEEAETCLLHTRGVISARVSYRKQLATLDYDPELTDPEAIAARLSALGYTCGKPGIGVWLLDGLCLVATALLVWLLSRPGSPVKAPAGSGFAAFFLLGLFSSPHCVGMCGGVLLGTAADSPRAWRASLGYNVGRIASYTAIGALFGALGTALHYSGSVKSMVFTMLGLAVALLGLNQWGLLPGLRALLPEQPSPCRLPARLRSEAQPLLIGLLTGLMPCGALYAMWLQAVAAGSALRGAAAMLAFALGTAPLLLLFGSLSSLLPRRWNKAFRKAGAVLVTAMGLKMLLSGLRLAGFL